MDLKEKIMNVPDFPKKGIVFRDITTLLQDPHALRHSVGLMAEHYRETKIDKVVATESRGFIFGAILAHQLETGFVPLRKPGKLPRKTIRQEFETEYSTDAFEVHEDAIEKGDDCLVVDDLIATGGTTKASCELVEKLGGNVAGVAALIEFTFLDAQEKLKGYDVFSLVQYDSE